MEKMTIGKFISALRRANGMTQKELGERLYVSDKTVSRWERDECTPELNLIPAIAEIFGVTSDELLRGQRRTDAADTPDAAARLKTKSDKQWRALLQRRSVRFRNLSLISRGIALLGLIAAAICDLCFNRALLGFCLGLVFLMAAGISQLCFAASARLHPDEDEPERHGDIAAFNASLTRTAVAVFSLIGGVLAFTLPLLLVEAYYGLATGSWLLLGLICVAISLIAGHLFYAFFLRLRFVKRGWLNGEDAQQTARDRQLLLRLAKLLLPAVGVLIAAIVALGLAGHTWLAHAEKFDNYADFEAFMAKEAVAAYREEWESQGFSVTVHPQGCLVKDEYGDIIDSILFSTDTVTDAQGNVFSTYVSGAASLIRFSFDQSPDGLPVLVYTFTAMRRAYALRQGIQAALFCAIGLIAIVGTVVYLVQRRKDI